MATCIVWRHNGSEKKKFKFFSYKKRKEKREKKTETPFELGLERIERIFILFSLTAPAIFFITFCVGVYEHDLLRKSAHYCCLHIFFCADFLGHFGSFILLAKDHH